MERLGALTVLCILAGIVSTASCGDPFAVAGEGGKTTTSHPTGSGGTGGTSGTTSSGEAGSDAGTTVPPCVPGQCAQAGHYCEKSSMTCQPCSDPTRFTFGNPAGLPMGFPLTNARSYFPRVAPDTGALFFSHKGKGSGTLEHLASAPYSQASQSWGTWTMLPAPINSLDEESAPLYLANGAALNGLVDTTIVSLDTPVLLFNSTRQGTEAIYAANLEGAKDVALVALPPSKSDEQIAVAVSQPRFFWVSDNTTQPGLVTWTPAMTAPEHVDIELDNGCSIATLEGLTGPWVSSDGTLLLFGAVYPEPSTCTLKPGSPQLIFYARLDGSTGKQAAGNQARQIFPGSVKVDATPSLSADLCTLYFSRVDASADVLLYKAERE